MIQIFLEVSVLAQTKTKITITIDCDVYESAKTKYNNISGRINELLAMDLYGSDEKNELVERLRNLQLEEKSITKRLCELEKKEAQIQADNTNKESVLKWVKDVYQRNGVVGLNKLEAECKRYHVDIDDIVYLMEESGVAYVNFA